MTGLGTQIPGNWYLAEHAYPQIEYFAQSGQETAASYSRASVIALQLPAGTTLMEVLEGSGIALPEEIDGMGVQWDAEGDVVINAENQVEIGVNATISYHETPTVGTSLTLDCGAGIHGEQFGTSDILPGQIERYHRKCNQKFFARSLDV